MPTPNSSKNTVLVTGGLGFIGSHTILELLSQNLNVVTVDNLSNSRMDTLNRLEAHSGKKIYFHQVDIKDSESLSSVFEIYELEESPISPISVVIHFAALKSVNESSSIPLNYYENNVYGTICLLNVMKQFNVSQIIFSSSATVYGSPSSKDSAFISEEAPTPLCSNTYGRTKKMCEDILQDVCKAEKGWKVVLLRYFNPVGAHPDAVVGEDPLGIPNNLMPFVSRVAISNYLGDMTNQSQSLSIQQLASMKHLSIFGSDYETPDGTGVRDFIHVMDLANGHLKALESVLKPCKETMTWWNEPREKNASMCRAYNLGCGKGYSVLEMVRAFERVNGVDVPFVMAPRRIGDIPSLCANPLRAEKELGFKCMRGLDEMCADQWNWQRHIVFENNEEIEH